MTEIIFSGEVRKMGSNEQKTINIRSILAILTAFFIVVAVVCVNFWYDKKKAIAPDHKITNFEECVKAGNPVTKSDPEQCQTSDGKFFIQEITKNTVEEFAKILNEKYAGYSIKISMDLIDDMETHFRGKYWLGSGKEGEGENFFAMRNGDEYEIIFDGSSGFICESLSMLGFSKEMQEGCYEQWMGTGTIKGSVDIGPICPVEREGIPCAKPYEAYTSRSLTIYDAGDKKEIFSSPIKPDGTYNFVLTSGSYIIDIKRQGMDTSSYLPHEFMLVDGQALEFDFSIDTGIR